MLTDISIGGASASLTVTETEFISETTLANPPSEFLPIQTGDVFKVLTDETLNNLTLYYKWDGAKWVEVPQVMFPTTSEGINSLQYVYNGAWTAFA